MKSQTAIILILVFVTLSVTNGAHLYANAGLLLKLFGLFPSNNNYNTVVDIYGKHSVLKSFKIIQFFSLDQNVEKEDPQEALDRKNLMDYMQSHKFHF